MNPSSPQSNGPVPDQGGQPSRPDNYTSPAFGQNGVPVPTHHPDYAFIMDPSTAQRRQLIHFGVGNSLIGRLAFVLGGLLVLVILFSIGKSLLGGHKSNATSLLSVTQDQQLLIHIATSAALQQEASTPTRNSSSTIAVSISSAQKQLISYMAQVGLKTSTAQLTPAAIRTDDAQLAAASSAGTYDATYHSVVGGALQNYQQALKQAYVLTSGQKGRAILTDQYNGAVLLSQQLGS